MSHLNSWRFCKYASLKDWQVRACIEGSESASLAGHSRLLGVLCRLKLLRGRHQDLSPSLRDLPDHSDDMPVVMDTGTTLESTFHEETYDETHRRCLSTNVCTFLLRPPTSAIECQGLRQPARYHPSCHWLLGDKDSKIFHKSDCKTMAKIKPENLITFSSKAKAEKAGYMPCNECKP